MTKKRFVLEDEVIIDDNSIADDGGRQLYWTVEYVQRQKLVDLMNTLADENEQLKLTIKEVTELLSEEVDLFSDKATEHDINAYVELNQLDNKDAYYMATATKKAIKMLKELQE